MSLDFYVFDVDHGQSAAAKLPNGEWCIFDVGSRADFSAVQWIRGVSPSRPQSVLEMLAGVQAPFSFLKATISHLHGDHLTDYANLLAAGPRFLRTVDFDQQYLHDTLMTSSDSSRAQIRDFCTRYAGTFSPTVTTPDYGGTAVTESSLGVPVARALGGSPNSRVNNASVITRIDCYGRAILICGDLEREGWEFALERSLNRGLWHFLVRNLDILVAPHHGHTSGYSAELMELARPQIVIASVVGGDESIDSRYSSDAVRGLTAGGRFRRCVTTRNSGHIGVSIQPPVVPTAKGAWSWAFERTNNDLPTLLQSLLRAR